MMRYLLSKRLLLRALLGAMAACGCGFMDCAGAQTVSEFTVPTAGSEPRGITAEPDGALWFTEFTSNKIGRITTTGTISEFPLPTTASVPLFITAGPDDALSFVEFAGNKIGRITTAGTVTAEFPVPTAGSQPFEIAAGPDGGLWFVEQTVNKVGTLLPVPPAGPSPLVASVLPTSRSVQVGSVATVFASIINSGKSPLADCRIVPSTFVNGFFSYQTTNPATNALIGSPNTYRPVRILDGTRAAWPSVQC
jgi:streptogramin lyase